VKAEARLPTNPAAEPSSTRLILTLAVAGFVSGLAIIAIYELTLPTITANKAESLRQAVFKVLPGVTKMQMLAYREGTLLPVGADQQAEQIIYEGYDKAGNFVGYAIPGEGAGFQDTIRLLYGYQPAKGLVVGMEVLESRETPGLGDKIYKDANFVSGFRQLAADPEIVSVKKGTKSAPNEIDAITGATISSQAVVRIINETNQVWGGRFDEYR
jgi:electron transport complex protein RnfG